MGIFARITLFILTLVLIYTNDRRTQARILEQHSHRINRIELYKKTKANNLLILALITFILMFG